MRILFLLLLCWVCAIADGTRGHNDDDEQSTHMEHHGECSHEGNHEDHYHHQHDHQDHEGHCHHHHHEHDEHDDTPESDDTKFLHENWYATIESNDSIHHTTQEVIPMIFNKDGLSYLTPFNMYRAIDADRMVVGVVFYYQQNCALCEDVFYQYVRVVQRVQAVLQGTSIKDKSTTCASSRWLLMGQVDLTAMDDKDDDEELGRESLRATFGPNRTRLFDYPTITVMYWDEGIRGGGRLQIVGYDGPLTVSGLLRNVARCKRGEERLSQCISALDLLDVAHEEGVEGNTTNVTFSDGILDC